jgi:Arc/MetJ-type ribon-helix-helix transcriptional regulator
MFYLKFHVFEIMNREKRYEKRIALRLSVEEKDQLERLVNRGKFRNLSEAIRTALKEYLRYA